MGTKANPGEFDCYNAAKDDEPMFILLARDRHAAVLTMLWAFLRYRSGEDVAKVKEALQVAVNMDLYYREVLGKQNENDSIISDICSDLMETVMCKYTTDEQRADMLKLFLEFDESRNGGTG